MSPLTAFALKEEYKRLENLGDKLSEIESLIDWKPFRPMIDEMYNNKTELGGRPNNDAIVMLKMIVLQQWHGLSDPELEKQATDRISFRKFLGFPNKIPDRSTVWDFKERISKTGKESAIWDEMQRQLDAKTRRNKDGTWSKKGGKSYFGYKLHTIIDADFQLIRRIKTTTASLHDSQVDLSMKGEVAYRDKGYFGMNPRGYDATMQRGVRGHPIGIRDVLRNKRINHTRAKCERVYAVGKTIFGSGTVKVTTVARTSVKMLFTAFDYNLYQLCTLRKQGVIH